MGGVRRYQNKDGTLTSAGQARLDTYKRKETQKLDKYISKEMKRTNRNLERAFYKYDKAYSKNPRSNKTSSTRRKMMKTEFVGAYNVGRASLEKLKVAKMTYSDMRKEQIKVAVNVGISASKGGSALALFYAAYKATPVAAIHVPTPSYVARMTKSYNRIDIVDDQRIRNSASVATKHAIDASDAAVLEKYKHKQSITL